MIKNRLTRFAAVCLSLLLSLSITAGAATFPDVDGTTPEGVAIERLSIYGMVNGLPDGSYQPQKTVTRAEFCKFMFALGGGDLSLSPTELVTLLPDKAAFEDVPNSAWYAPYVASCIEFGVVNGVGNNQFAPERTLTMAEAVKMCYALTARATEGLSYPQGYWDAAQSAGYFKDMAQTISYDTPATRALAAKLCYNALWRNSIQWVSATPPGSSVTQFVLDIPDSYGVEQESNTIMAPGNCPFAVQISLSQPASDVSLTWETTGWVYGEDSAAEPPKEIQALAKLEILSVLKISDTQYEAVVAFPDAFTYEHGTFIGKFIGTANGKSYDSATYTLYCRGGGGM